MEKKNHQMRLHLLIILWSECSRGTLIFNAKRKQTHIMNHQIKNKPILGSFIPALNTLIQLTSTRRENLE